MLISFLGISARPHHIDQTFSRVQQSIRSSYPLQTATNIARIVEYYPWWSNLWLHAARFALQAGDFETAIKYYSRYGSTQDLPYEDKIRIGDAFQQLGDLESAEQLWLGTLQSLGTSEDIYTRLAEIHRSGEIYVRLADIHRSQDNIPALINDLKSLYEIHPNDANNAFELGLLLVTQEPESALIYLEEAAQMDPKLRESALDLQRKINTARLAEEPAYTFLEVGRILANMQEWKLATQAFHQATRAREDYSEAWAFLGEAKQHLTSPGSASQTEPAGQVELDTALQLNPSSVTANVLMGIFWQRQNQYERSLPYIRSASNLDPENPMLHAELGRVLARLGDLDAAKVEYEQAIEIAPQDPTYWRLLAEFSMHYQLEIRQIALPAARQAIILSPNDPESLDVIGQTLIMLGDDYNAERYLLRALEEDREFAPAHMHLGIIYMNQGDVTLARSQFALAKDIAPDSYTMDQAQRLIGYYFP